MARRKKRQQKAFRQNVQKFNIDIGKEKKQHFHQAEDVLFEKPNQLGKKYNPDEPFTKRNMDAANRKIRKHARKQQSETFRQNVQKSDVDNDKEIKKDFVEDNNVFLEQSDIGDRRSDSMEDYHRRDTYQQTQKNKKYYRKRIKEKSQRKGLSKESVFTERTESGFTDTTSSELMGSKKLQKKQRQVQKARREVEKAKARLPKKQKYTLQKTFNEKTGKGKYVVIPIDREKSFRDSRFVRDTVRRIQNKGNTFVHGKITEVEKENSAVEGAHRSEQKAENLFGFAKQWYQGKEQRQRAKVAKLEKKQFKREVNFQYQKFLEENPQIQKKALRKRLQKQRIKREYIKARRKAAASTNAKETISKSVNMVTVAASKLQDTARKHAGLFVTVGIMVVLLVMVMTSVSSCGAIFINMQSTILAASYLSKPKEIDAADLKFTHLELDLQKQIDCIETDYPGYDEYSYNLGEIGHNPFTLIGYLSAIYTEFTATEVEREIQALFEEMYTLTLTPDTEIRTRTVRDPDTGDETEEEYEVDILRVVLISKPLETLTAGKMDTDQTEIYGMYGETKGLLQEFASPLNLYWYYYISSYYGYRKNSATGAEELHRGVDISVPIGTTVYASHDGIVTVGYDNHYGNYVVIEKDDYTTKYAHMESLSVSNGQNVTKGMAVGTTGNTGSSTGSHLHMEYLYNGEYYNPLFYFAAGLGTLYGEVPEGTMGNVVPPDSYDDITAQALMEEAAKYLGFPYVWGGSRPSTSFDCSGFVCWVFTHSGVHDLPRTTAQGIYDKCIPISASDAKAGDIIFFTGTYNSPGPVSHVGIYCGNGVMIHCGDPISYASVNSSYWQSHFYSYGRLY